MITQKKICQEKSIEQWLKYTLLLLSATSFEPERAQAHFGTDPDNSGRKNTLIKGSRQNWLRGVRTKPLILLLPRVLARLNTVYLRADAAPNQERIN